MTIYSVQGTLLGIEENSEKDCHHADSQEMWCQVRERNTRKSKQIHKMNNLLGERKNGVLICGNSQCKIVYSLTGELHLSTLPLFPGPGILSPINKFNWVTR